MPCHTADVRAVFRTRQKSTGTASHVKNTAKIFATLQATLDSPPRIPRVQWVGKTNLEGRHPERRAQRVLPAAAPGAWLPALAPTSRVLGAYARLPFAALLLCTGRASPWGSRRSRRIMPGEESKALRKFGHRGA